MKFKNLHSLFRTLPEPIDNVFTKVKKRLGIKELGLYKHFEKRTVSLEKRASITTNFQKQLISEFQFEIKLVEKILNKDLSHWTERQTV